MPTHIETEMLKLDPGAQVVIRMLLHFHQEQMAKFCSLKEQVVERDAKLAERDAKLLDLQTQNDKFRKMLFGRRSEKMPPICQ